MCRRRSIVIPLLLLLVLCAPVPVVQVAADDGSPVRRCLFAGPTVVTVSYVHSVERTPVLETYVARLAGLRLGEVRWQSFGAGLPDEYDAREDDFYVRRMDVELGRRLDYWFLPLNQVQISVGERLVFEGPAAPSRVSVFVRFVPLVAVSGSRSLLSSAAARVRSAAWKDQEHPVAPVEFASKHSH